MLDAAYTLAASPRTRSVDVLGGRYDLFVTGYFSSSDDLLDFLTNTVAQLDGVIETETFQCLRTVKRHFLTWSREDAEPKVPGSGV